MIVPLFRPADVPPALSARAREGAIGLLVMLVSLYAASSAAQVSPRPLAEAITTEVDDPCLSPANLASRAAAWLQITAVDEQLTVVILGPAEGGAEELAFELSYNGALAGRREFAALPASCDERTAVVGVAVGMATEALLRNPPSAPAGVGSRASPPNPSTLGTAQNEPTPPSLETPPLVEAPTGAETTGPPPEWSVGLRAAAGVRAGPVPAFGGLITTELSVRYLNTWRLGLAVEVGPEHDHELIAGRAISSLLGGAASLCGGGLLHATIGLEGCGGARVAVMSARGRDLDQVRAVELPWVAIAVGARSSWAITSQVGLTLSLAALVNVVRPSLGVEDFGGRLIGTTDAWPVGAEATIGCFIDAR